MPVAFSFSWHLSAEAKKLLACINQRSPLPFLLIWPSYQHLPTTTGFMLFLVSSPLKLSQVGVPWGSVYKRYIYMILLFHWTIAYCKATKRIGTLNFTNLNLPFVVINLLMVCLSIAGHTTQGHTGCQKHVCLLLGLILVTSKRSGMLGQREYVTLGISMILCITTDLVPTSVCMPFGASD